MKLKSLLILLLAAILLLSSVPAFAAEETAAQEASETESEQETSSGEGVWAVINTLLALGFIASIFLVSKIADKKKISAPSNQSKQ